MTIDKKMLRDIAKYSKGRVVIFVNNMTSMIVGKGIVGSVNNPFLRDVYLVESLKHNPTSI